MQFKKDKRITVFGLYENESNVSKAMVDLRASKFRPDEISVLFPDRGTSRDLVHEKSSKAPEGATTGGATGALLGGLGGWLVGIGALTIPGLGPFIAGGPIMAALSGTAVGGAVGAMTGALVGMGIPEIEAKQYEDKIRRGGFLVSIHAHDSQWAYRARKILESTGAKDISSTNEANVPGAPERGHVKMSK